jgi:hypothetical protein
MHQIPEDADFAIDVVLACSRCREAQRHGIGGELFTEMLSYV